LSKVGTIATKKEPQTLKSMSALPLLRAKGIGHFSHQHGMAADPIITLASDAGCDCCREQLTTVD